MFGLVFILMSYLVMIIISQHVEEKKGVYDYYKNKNREYAIKKIKENYEYYMIFPVASGANYRASTTVYPMPNFANAVAGTPEIIPFKLSGSFDPDFKDIRLFLNNNVGGSYLSQNNMKLMVADASQPDEYFSTASSWPYGSSPNYANQIEYGRQIVFDSYKLSNNSAFISASTCSTNGNYGDRQDVYCPAINQDVYSFKIESKNYVSKLLAAQKRRLALTLDKLFRAVNTQTSPFGNFGGAYQDQFYKVVNGSAMATTFPLACNSTYVFTPNSMNTSAIAQLDCSDMFGIYGQPINYYYFDTKHIALGLTMPVYHSAASTVAQEYNYDVFSDLDTNYIN